MIDLREIAIWPIGGGSPGPGPGPSPSAPDNDVRLIDYDGTLLYSYTAAEFAALSELPAAPEHAGLTAQGWNWTLAAAKAYVAKYGRLDIGQMYITDDGKTRIYIRLEEGRTSPVLGLAVNGTVTVDWGDGSPAEELTGKSLSSLIFSSVHNYPAPGDYIISLDPVVGGFVITGSSYSKLLAPGSDRRGDAYLNSIRKVELGANVGIGNNAFSSCYSLASVSIPATVTSIGNNAFSSCHSLASVVIPEGVTSTRGAFSGCHSLVSVSIPATVTSLGNSEFISCNSLASVAIPEGVTSISSQMFIDCHSLASVVIPEGVTSIGNNAFYYCYSLASVSIPATVTSIVSNAFSDCQSLASVVIPEGVTSIGSHAFQNCNSLASVSIPATVTSIGGVAFQYCYSLALLVVRNVTPPTLGTGLLNSTPSDLRIYVPDASVEAYKTATNWSAYAAKIYPISELENNA